MKQETKNIAKQESQSVELPQDRPVFVPATDIYETEKAIFLRCSMPGVSSDSLDVVLEDNVLTLTGHQRWKTPDDFQLVHQEYETGVFRRSFRISEEVDQNGIKAVMKNGVLNLELPKSPRAQPHKIKVEMIS
ncbi:MAG: Hsp20/alpha crystallin family protein [Kiritimatiellia bacterium]